MSNREPTNTESRLQAAFTKRIRHILGDRYPQVDLAVIVGTVAAIEVASGFTDQQDIRTVIREVASGHLDTALVEGIEETLRTVGYR